MDITIICSSENHPVFPYLQKWAKNHSNLYNISLINHSKDVKSGDFLFLISCTEIIKLETRKKFKHVLVIHESDVPLGRGWSPLIWQILEGKTKIVVTLLEANDRVDTGNVWKKKSLEILEHELAPEIYEKLFPLKLELMDFAIENYQIIKPIKQNESISTYYTKRVPEDSKLEVNKSIAEQFNLMRIADEKRYPCFFDYKGKRYKISLKKI